MILSAVLAATFSFSATATGLEKGAPVEFLFVGKDSDRDYEALFVLDGTVEDFCTGLEKAGVPRGKAVDPARCVLWPVGCPLKLAPAMNTFVTTEMPEGLPLTDLVYTGGTRDAKGTPIAHTNQPFSVFALYSLSQSPLVFNGVFEQGIVYNCHHAKETLMKGERRTFTLTWDEKTRPTSLKFVLKPGNVRDVLQKIREASSAGELDVQVDFADELTVAEATQAAKALAVVDTLSVKINGRRDGGLFYRAFLPLVKWQDRRERLVQPFELTVGATNTLVYIDEDWSVDGNDPKLTPKLIPFADAAKHDRTDTCFLYAMPQSRIAELTAAMRQLTGSNVKNWYVFPAP